MTKPVHAEYYDSSTWCGKGWGECESMRHPHNTEFGDWLSKVTCLDCLEEIICFGDRAARRLRKVEAAGLR